MYETTSVNSAFILYWETITASEQCSKVTWQATANFNQKNPKAYIVRKGVE